MLAETRPSALWHRGHQVKKMFADQPGFWGKNADPRRKGGSNNVCIKGGVIMS